MFKNDFDERFADRMVTMLFDRRFVLSIDLLKMVNQSISIAKDL